MYDNPAVLSLPPRCHTAFYNSSCVLLQLRCLLAIAIISVVGCQSLHQPWQCLRDASCDLKVQQETLLPEEVLHRFGLLSICLQAVTFMQT